MMRYQRVSPDCLPLSNGKKPSMRTLCKEDGATESNGKLIQTNGNNASSSSSSLEARAFRFRSPARNQDHHHSLTQFGGGVSDNNNHLHHSHHENNSNTHQSQRQESSPSPTPSPNHGSGDVLLQWGHKKRSRVSRTEIRALTDESSSSAQARQGVKLQRRVVHSSSSSEKLSANATMPPPPPPPLPSISSSSNGRARKETSGLLPSRNLEDRPGAGNGSPLRNNGGGSGSRIVSRSASAAGKRSPPSPADNKNEKKVLGCSGKSGKEDKANGSSVQGGDRVNHVDSSSLQSEQEAAVAVGGAPNTTTNIAPSAAAVGGDKVNSFEVIEWPRIYVALSRKEKEDDFLAMKGTKLPQRPKKRAKNIDRTLQYCFPGMWLSDLTRNRYEVREKKCVKKQKRRGLKGMESIDSESE